MERKRKMEKKLIERKKLLRLKRQTKIKGNNEVPVDLKSYYASRRSDVTILQTLQTGGWLFGLRSRDWLQRSLETSFLPF